MPKNKPTPKPGTLIRKRIGKRSASRSSGAFADQEKSPEPFPIVGVGASAGGLEAFSAFLNHLATDTGFAFVLVQHLDPKHESILVDLLAKQTKMPVQEAQHGMVVNPNQVYVIPPTMDMAIIQGKLNLIERPDEHQQHTPIDYFFRSLADDQQTNAIGIVLSGTGTDGTLGLSAIKMEGGFTFAQEIKSARYDGMPRSAIAAGVVDFVLTPERIAAELMRIGRHPYIALVKAKEAEDIPLEGEDHLSRIFLLLRAATGVDFSMYKTATIRRRIARRMMLSKIEKLADYVRFIKDNSSEIDELFQDLLISVTGFFREPSLFEALKKVFPHLVKGRTAHVPIRLWVPACATGEEAYSIAICLLEYFESSAHVPVQIFATDVSNVGVEKARAGIYAESILADLSPERLRRYFIKTERGYQIAKAVRDLCVFARQDLTRDPPFSKMDLISCRNLLIYLNAPMQKKIITTFHYALNPDGILVLGSSETIGTSVDLFALVDKKHKIYQRKSVPTRVDFATHKPALLPPSIKSIPEALGSIDLQRQVDRILLTTYAPAGVFVDDALDILQFRGQTGDYLEPASGAPNFNLLKMVREGLKLELRAAIQKARQENLPAHRNGIRLKVNGKLRRVNIHVSPITFPHIRERYLLVLFEEASSARQVKPADVGRGTRGKPKHQIDLLQQELAVTKEYLQSTIEQLESTNEELRSALEEIQSSNEELQSTNEEVETAKEELQSTNEELTTVNEELQNRNGELTVLNNDLVNLIGGANVPIIILNGDLRIRRFTPMAEKLLNLIAPDIGRPISDLRLNVIAPNLEQAALNVMDKLESQEIQTQDRFGRWYSMRIRPYKTLDNKIDGVMISWIDIDTLKREGEQVQSAEHLMQSVIDTVSDPLVILDEQLSVKAANEPFYRLFGIPPEQATQRNLFQLQNGMFDLAPLRHLIEKVLPTMLRPDTLVVDVRVNARVHRFSINARRIFAEDEHTPLTVLALEEITGGASA